LVEDITDWTESEREEYVDEIDASPSTVGHKRNVHDTMDITLPHLPNAVITVDDMLGNVPKLRYADHDVCNVDKFQDLAVETYLKNIGEIGPLGKPIMEPVQWIIGLYSSGMMNLLDTLHFGHSKNFELCVNHIVTYIHGGIIWMDTPVQIAVALISKIIGLSTINA